MILNYFKEMPISDLLICDYKKWYRQEWHKEHINMNKILLKEFGEYPIWLFKAHYYLPFDRELHAQWRLLIIAQRQMFTFQKLL